MKRRTFFKYLTGCVAIPFLGMTKAREVSPQLFVDIDVGYKGKKYAGRIDLSNFIKENGKIDIEKFDHYSRLLIGSGRRRLQEEGAVEYYRNDDGTEIR